MCIRDRAWAEQRRQLLEKTGGKVAAVTMHMHVITQPSGQKRANPFYERIRELRLDLDRLVRNFGGNPAARSRVQASTDFQDGDVDRDGAPAAAAPRATAEIKTFRSFK